jgi:hypothetical protein
MSDVSNYPDQANADLGIIMNGGTHFLDRMNAFLSAKDKAEAIIAAANAEAERIAGEAAKDRAQSLKVVDDARLQASKIMQEANNAAISLRASADKVLVDAQQQAAGLVAKAKADAVVTADAADALMATAKQAKANVDQRSAELASKESLAEQVKASAEAALAEATSVKQKYENLISQLKAVMSSEG